MLQCGCVTTGTGVDPLTGEVSETKDVMICGSPDCPRKLCFLRGYNRKRKRHSAFLEAAFGDCERLGRQLVMLTLKTYWELPRREAWFGDGKREAMRMVGRGRPVFTRPYLTPEELSGEVEFPSLLGDRMEKHVKSRVAWADDPRVREMLGLSRYFTEQGWLMTTVDGYRCWPNPHTHVLTTMPVGISLEEARQKLEEVFAEKVGYARVEVLCTPIILNEDTRQALPRYFAKTMSMTEDVKLPGWRGPQRSDLSTVLDDRSLMEVIDFVDFSGTKRLSGNFNWKRKSRAAVKMKVKTFKLGGKVVEKEIVLPRGPKKKIGKLKRLPRVESMVSKALREGAEVSGGDSVELLKEAVKPPSSPLRVQGALAGKFVRSGVRGLIVLKPAGQVGDGDLLKPPELVAAGEARHEELVVREEVLPRQDVLGDGAAPGEPVGVLEMDGSAFPGHPPRVALKPPDRGSGPRSRLRAIVTRLNTGPP
jgi:hypothetical protein